MVQNKPITPSPAQESQCCLTDLQGIGSAFPETIGLIFFHLVSPDISGVGGADLVKGEGSSTADIEEGPVLGWGRTAQAMDGQLVSWEALRPGRERTPDRLPFCPPCVSKARLKTMARVTISPCCAQPRNTHSSHGNSIATPHLIKALSNAVPAAGSQVPRPA